ncbi:hypothetical protein QZN10_40165, partial [Burkholderia contaminans]|nr:hypothetical protein [Burkholderia contaminans]
EREQQNQRVTKSYPHRNRCTTLSRGGSDLDEIGGLRLGGNQQFMRYVHTEDKPVREAAELVASRRKAITGAKQQPAEATA